MSAFNPRLPLVAILRGITPPEVLAHARALVDAGFDCIEVPTNSPEWAASVKLLVQQFGSAVQVGIGTALTAEHVAQCAAAGGRLIVTPHVDARVAEAAHAHDMLLLMGVFTATEMFTALALGAHALKVFPASSAGPQHCKALRAVLSAPPPMLAVGGVSPANLRDYLDAGCTGAGLGGELYRPGQDAATTAAHAAAFVREWSAWREAKASP